MSDAQIFRQAWGKFATGVAVVTTIQPDGHVHGMAANGINSVSLDPLLVLVCVGHTRNSYPLIRESGRFCINILCEDQQPLAEYYARAPETRKGDVNAAFRFTKRGSATIDGSLAFMDCYTVNEYEAGDHTIFVAGVDEICIGDGNPLLYYEGKFGRLGEAVS